MTPMQAIQAGTIVNAELLGWGERVGSIEAAKLADIIAVPGDLLRDLSVLVKVTEVWLWKLWRGHTRPSRVVLW